MIHTRSVLLLSLLVLSQSVIAGSLVEGRRWTPQDRAVLKKHSIGKDGYSLTRFEVLNYSMKWKQPWIGNTSADDIAEADFMINSLVSIAISKVSFHLPSGISMREVAFNDAIFLLQHPAFFSLLTEGTRSNLQLRFQQNEGRRPDLIESYARRMRSALEAAAKSSR